MSLRRLRRTPRTRVILSVGRAQCLSGMREGTMAFDVSLEMTDKKVAKITLSGELDASVAPQFKEKIEEASKQGAKRLALLMEGLSYIASAGIRVLIFAKQKMGSGVDIFVVAPQEQVMETLEMTGLQYSVEVLEAYSAEKIETL